MESYKNEIWVHSDVGWRILERAGFDENKHEDLREELHDMFWRQLCLPITERLY